MNICDIIVLGAIFLCLFISIMYMIGKKRKGKRCGYCDGCNSCASCSYRQKEEEQHQGKTN